MKRCCWLCSRVPIRLNSTGAIVTRSSGDAPLIKVRNSLMLVPATILSLLLRAYSRNCNNGLEVDRLLGLAVRNDTTTPSLGQFSNDTPLDRPAAKPRVERFVIHPFRTGGTEPSPARRL